MTEKKKLLAPRLVEIAETFKETAKPDPKKAVMENFMSSMYAVDDDEDEDAPAKPAQVPISDVTMAVVDKSVIVVIDGKKIEIPNMVYVRTLERTINKQAREIQRLTNATKNLRERANTLLAEVKDVWKEVGYKIDQRGMS